MRKNLIITIFSILLVGCASNPYRDFYEANTFSPEDEATFEFLKENQEPILVEGNKDTLEEALSNGYNVLGTSSFNGPTSSKDAIISQAKHVKATHVIFNSEYTDTESGTYAIAMPDYKTSNTYGTVYGNNGNWETYSGTTTTQGTTWIPKSYNVRRYNQSAAFLVHSNKKYNLGILFQDLNNSQRQIIGRNTGVLVNIVINGTPAFKSNFLKGDILLEINGTSIYNVDSLINFLDSLPRSTRKITFDVYRNGEIKKIDVALDLSSKN